MSPAVYYDPEQGAQEGPENTRWDRSGRLQVGEWKRQRDSDIRATSLPWFAERRINLDNYVQTNTRDGRYFRDRALGILERLEEVCIAKGLQEPTDPWKTRIIKWEAREVIMKRGSDLREMAKTEIAMFRAATTYREEAPAPAPVKKPKMPRLGA